MTPRHSQATAEEITELERIFLQKDWSLTRKNQTGSSILECIKELFKLLTPKQRKLVSELLIDFTYCTFSEYGNYFTKALDKIQIAPTTFNEIFLLPTATSQSGSPKSSETLMYAAKNELLPQHAIGSGKQINSYISLEAFKKRHPNRGPCLVIFVDDFIGTGEQALRTLGTYGQQFRGPNDVAIVVTLIALEIGAAKLQANGFSCFAGEIKKKGITDSSVISDKRAAKRSMTLIESKIVTDIRFKHGFGQSEALVSLIRTPNNTFPMFWMEEHKTGDPWPWIFKR